MGASAARFYGGFGLQLEENITERFTRLAKLAQEWRRDRDSSHSVYSADQHLLGGQHLPAKPSAKELLQAAVEGVALGACT